MKLFILIFLALSSLYGNAKPVEVDLSAITGRRVADLYGEYLGLTGVAPPKAKINFEENLGALWDRKLERRRVTPSTERHAPKVIEQYRRQNKATMTLGQFIDEADREITLARRHINWRDLCSSYRLDDRRCKLLQSIGDNIRGKDLVAYGLTELMPSTDGQFNVQFLDILLRHAGREYVQALPALYDGMLSFGFYQFTSHALRHDSSVVTGASRVSQYVGNRAKLPGSVALLKGEEHHRAAFFFAVNNLAQLITRLRNRDVSLLQRDHKKVHGEIVQYIATSHHLPGPAMRGARRWIANDMRQPLRVSLNPKLQRYAAKTRANLDALN